MMRVSNIAFVIFLLENYYYANDTTLIVDAWTTITTTTTSKRNHYFFKAQNDVQRSSSSKLKMTNTPFDENDFNFPNDDDDDEACGDEEECEIDWSMMPDFDEVEEAFPVEDSNNSMTLSTTEAFLRTAEHAKKELDDLNTNAIEMENMRTRLEMMFEIDEKHDECDVYRPVTCGGHVCVTCNGQGIVSCRFCRGTKQLYMTKILDNGTKINTFVPCQICNTNGHEICKSCQGSGWIAGWTDISNIHAGSK